MSDVALARALRLVEKLIAKRLSDLQERAVDPTASRNAAKNAHQRADELGLLIGEIRAARISADGPAN